MAAANGHGVPGDSPAGAAGDPLRRPHTVIVHPAGSLDDPDAGRYWTEVPALAACTAVGATVEEAVENTRQQISRWLSRTDQHVAAGISQVGVDIELAF